MFLESKNQLSVDSAADFANALEKFAKENDMLAKQREVSNFVQKVFPEEYTRGPRVDTVPFGASITLDMHHANDSQASSSDASAKSYVSQVPGAIRELEVDAGPESMDLGHLLDAPVLPQPAGSSKKAKKADKAEPSQPANQNPRAIPNRAAPKAQPAKAIKGSGFGFKHMVLILVVLLGGLAVAYEKTDIVKDLVSDVEGMLEEEGPPEVAVDENPLLREHGARSTDGGPERDVVGPT